MAFEHPGSAESIRWKQGTSQAVRVCLVSHIAPLSHLSLEGFVVTSVTLTANILQSRSPTFPQEGDLLGCANLVCDLFYNLDPSKQSS